MSTLVPWLVLAQAAPVPPPQLTLERAMQLAVEHNERGAAAKERISAAEARLARARAFFFPELTLNGSYTRNLHEVERNGVVIQSSNALGANAVGQLALFDARGFPLYAQASHDRRATELESREELRVLAFETAEAYVSALSAEQVLAAAQRRLEFAKASLHDAESRFEAQLVSSNDVTKAKLEVATAERETVRARGALETAYVALGYLIAEDVRGPLIVPDALLTEAQAPIPAGSASEAAARRLDLAARRERVEALKSFALEPRMRLIPTLNLVARYALTNDPGFSTNSDNGSAALTLSWIAFDGGERYADARERAANAQVALLDTMARERRVGADLRQADVAVASAQAALKQAEVAAEAAEQNAKEISTLYRQGLTSALEAANASFQRFDAQVQLARERFGLALAFLDLRSALGLDPLGREPKR